jgi:GTP-binding protein
LKHASVVTDSSEAACAGCDACVAVPLRRHGLDVSDCDFVVALAGNPNTGKSTVFNALTGLRQHVGNWPGKTVVRAEGAFRHGGAKFKVVDLPGTYSLLSQSTDEEIARDFILFGRPDVTVVVVDATCLERNLNLVLQVLEITNRVVTALNLMDEAERLGMRVDDRALARDLGVPVVPMAARRGRGVRELAGAIDDVARGRVALKSRRLQKFSPELEAAIEDLLPKIEREFPGLPNTRWVALRLLEGDESVIEEVRAGTLGSSVHSVAVERPPSEVHA